VSAPVTAEELAEIVQLVKRSAEDRGTKPGDLLAVKLERLSVDLAPRLARDLAAARYDLTAERETSARLADRALDLGRELEALRAAVRAHEAHARAYCRIALAQRDLDLWTAAKVTP